jgi:hypothetical protein
VYIVIIAYALSGVFLHASTQSDDEHLPSVGKPFIPQFLGFTEADIVLGSLIVLFTAFVIVQFRYFFGGQANITISGYTYAEYARRGFGELVVVAFISLILFLGLSAVVKRQNATQRRVFSGLGLLLVALVGVMLFSAFQRLVLYETAYGFTRLRAYTHVFMLWLGVLLAAVVVIDLLRKERAFALAMVLASIGFAASITIMNVDGFIVRHNVTRSAQGEDLDVGYLASLSSDSIPGLVKALQDKSLPDGTRDRIGAALACQAHATGGQPDANWRSFTFSRLWAEQALKGLQGVLDNYNVVDDNWPVVVETPAGGTYDCSAVGGMN